MLIDWYMRQYFLIGMLRIQWQQFLRISMSKASMKNNYRRLRIICAELGFCSANEADFYITAGLVTVNGDVKRNPEELFDTNSCRVMLTDRALRMQEEKKTIILHKPHFYHTIGSPVKDRLHVRNLLRAENQVSLGHVKLPDLKCLVSFHLAEREVDQISGLIVFTQDGRVARKLNERHSSVPKTYVVQVKSSISDKQIHLLGDCVLDGERLFPVCVEAIAPFTLSLQLHQYKPRQIRRMCELVGLDVLTIHKTQIGCIQLGNLPLGKWRILQRHEKF